MRLDYFLFQNNNFSSRTKASEAIARGEVKVNGKLCKKASFNIADSDVVTVEEVSAFVSNGGYKLEKAFYDFGLSAEGLIFADIGASTGGFTDCLLKHGAKKVFAIDVGESLLDKKLKDDERVITIENFNARNLTIGDIGEKVDGVVCDVSFISLTYILKPISDILKDSGYAVVLVKPQFECGKRALNGNGIVTKKEDRFSAVEKICNFSKELNLFTVALTNAPLKDGKNVEYLLFLSKKPSKEFDLIKIFNYL